MSEGETTQRHGSNDLFPAAAEAEAMHANARRSRYALASFAFGLFEMRDINTEGMKRGR